MNFNKINIAVIIIVFGISNQRYLNQLLSLLMLTTH